VDAKIANFPNNELIVNRHPDSGTIEAWTRGSPPTISPDHVQAFLVAAGHEDSRQYLLDSDLGPPGQALSERGFVSWRSQIEAGTPVIGPGGKVSIFRTTTSILVDITVRKRSGTLPSKWRALGTIYEPCLEEFNPWRDEIEIEALLGYFELSKYEPQFYLRPAFVFIFSVPGSAGDAVPWQTVRVEPATLSQEIFPREGLGQWHSTGGPYE